MLRGSERMYRRWKWLWSLRADVPLWLLRADIPPLGALWLLRPDVPPLRLERGCGRSGRTYRRWERVLVAQQLRADVPPLREAVLLRADVPRLGAGLGCSEAQSGPTAARGGHTAIGDC